MTVLITSNRMDAVGNAVTTSFPVTYYFQLSSDLVVTLGGVVQTLNTNYTVLGAGNPVGGSVVFTVAPASGAKIVIRNIPPATQLVDFVNNVTLLESVIDGALDKLTILSQQLAASLQDAMLKDSLITTPVWLGQGYEVTNISAGLANNSAATVAQILSLVVASGNVPTPLLGDVGNFLKATATGVFSWQVLPSVVAATDTVAGIVELATVAEVRSAAVSPANTAITPALLESAAATVALTDAATVAVDWDTAINFTLTVTLNRTIGNPTNGQIGTWRTILVQGNDATLRTLTFGAQFLGEVPVIVDATSTKWYLLSLYCVSSTHFIVSSKRALG